MVATLVNYLLIDPLRVRERRSASAAAGRSRSSSLVSAIGLALNQAILAFVRGDRSSSRCCFSKLVATGVVFFWNYFARRVLVFGAAHA